MSAEVVATAENTYSLAGKQLKLNTHDDIKQYVEEIEAVTGLAILDISGNTIGIEASESLSKAILKHKDSIVDINFSDIYTGRLNTEIPQSLDHLLPALLQLSNLQKLDLSDNALGLQAIEPIESYLEKAVTLEHLILSNNGMGPFAGARIGTSLFKLAQAKKSQKKSSLKTFICGRNRLENGSVDRLAIGLRNHTELETVRLYQNGIRPAGASKLISQGLSKNKHLKVVDLQDNTLTTSASIALAAALPQWKALSELNVNDCLLKAQGSLNLVKALLEGESRNELTVLKLQFNELNQEALEKLVKVVGDKLPNLQSLELNGNIFEEDSESIDLLNEIFEERGFGEIDELDDLEELDSDEEESDDENEDALPEDVNLDELEKELAGLTTQDEDSKVDDLAGDLAKTHIK
ncbi:ran GTPase-activating protein 1 [[Candida] anglica]|uniref:Ran GTPase-activating protein 1 n=1 Tax=[Candida] anglica TaxID=148631 RepID=A0ABP0EIK8_9ASCO